MIIKVKTITIDVNVIDVNVVTRNKITKEQVFQEKEPRKNKNIVDQKKEHKSKKIMVKTIQQLQKTQVMNKGSSTSSIKGWNTMWLGMLDITPSIKPHKPQESIVSQTKFMLIEEIFQDIVR